MATPKQVTEPAIPTATAHVAEPAGADRIYDPNKKIRVADKTTGKVVDRPVPETWLDGRFPNLKVVPSSKAGK